MRLFNTIVVFSVAITVQKRGNCSLAHTVVHTADMTNNFSCKSFRIPPISFLLIRFSTGDFYHFFKGSSQHQVGGEWFEIELGKISRMLVKYEVLPIPNVISLC